eukprot:CAMPEP_0185560834 /NCGR_PEP_ID=MMETSP1381-20130426/57815_1 /TAXON_ID=298111 /ORGANISM="Pavlova sp., Strain CCMP459" /LENGTH=72 /DNA_ID=CAMNT_0028174571 /DNA_START=286 /DNA_END=501 /DNA_ORIENTATION=-
MTKRVTREVMSVSETPSRVRSSWARMLMGSREGSTVAPSRSKAACSSAVTERVLTSAQSTIEAQPWQLSRSY